MKYSWNLEEKIILFKKYFQLEEYHINHELFRGGNSPTFTREVFERGNVVAVLLYDPNLQQVVLTEQFRIGAIHKQSNPWLIECVAGVIDEGETPVGVAHRESLEEAGCKIQELKKITEYFVSPGGTTEHCSLFCGICDSSDAGGIHGLEYENEDIRVLVIPSKEAFDWINSGKIISSATIIALQWLQLNELIIMEQNKLR
jgi:ADP-ribose pyrophosphatase